MSMMNKESETLFDKFPTEIIFIIFNYLSSNDIIYTFLFLNKRFNNLLLQNSNYLNYFELPTTNLNIWNNIIPIIKSHIEYLKINTFDLSFTLTLFSNIKSIIISSPFDIPDKQLKIIVDNDLFINLHSLKMIENQIFDNRLWTKDLPNRIYILKKIFNDKNSLKIFQYSFIIPSSEILIIKNFQINYTLNSLTLILNYFKDIFILISHTPNLEYLNIRSRPPYKHEKSINNINIKLKELHFKFDEDPILYNSSFIKQICFDKLIYGIEQFSSSLICLSLNLVDIKEFPFNNFKLEYLLELMIQLKQFHFYAKLNEDFIDYDNILNNFKKNFTFGMHKNYLYTLPFYFDYLHEFYYGFNDVKSNNPNILINNSQLWYKVKSIELLAEYKYKKIFLKELKIKMPKLNLIKFFCIDKIEKNLYLINDENENIDIKLDNIITIEFNCKSIENENNSLINFIPNLKYFILSSFKFSLVENKIIEILNKKIQLLDINGNSELEQLVDRNYMYSSNIKYIQFCLNDTWEMPDWYANIIYKILKNYKKLKIFIIYVSPMSLSIIQLSEIIKYLDINEILNNYQLNHSQYYLRFYK